MSEERRKRNREYKLPAVEFSYHRDTIGEMADELPISPGLASQEGRSCTGHGKSGITREFLRIDHTSNRNNIRISRPGVAGGSQGESIRRGMRRKFVATADSKHLRPVVGNPPKLHFQPDQPAQAYVPVLSSVPAAEGRRPLMMVTDLAGRFFRYPEVEWIGGRSSYSRAQAASALFESIGILCKRKHSEPRYLAATEYFTSTKAKLKTA